MVLYRGRLMPVLVVALSTVTSAFKYHVEDQYKNTNTWSFTETYMYGSGKGPVPWKNGDSTIDLDFAIDLTSATPDAPNLNVIFYHDMHSELILPENDICSLQIPEDTTDLQMNSFTAEKAGEVWKFDVKAGYKVVNSGVQNVLFQVCPTTSAPTEEVALEGSISFENPYGFLPGRFYGYLPFEGVRFFAFLLFDMFFIAAVLLFRDNLLPLHYAILGVLVVATTEALAWFLAFNNLNNTGDPYCCPFPTSVVFAMVCELFQKTFSRALLAVICLGYGVARPKLGKGEWASVVLLSVLYFGASILDQVSEIMEATSIKNDSPPGDRVWWSFPALFCDIVFLTWIYLSLMTIMKLLKQQNETYKLEMYGKLSSTITGFVGVFGVMTVIVLLSRTGFIHWPWNLLWAETIAWEVLNFAVLAAVCSVWRPSSTSKLLCEAKQLPTCEDDGGETGIEFAEGTKFVDNDEEHKEGPVEVWGSS